MKALTVAAAPARLVFIGVWGLTFLYAVLSYAPFTYTVVIQSRLSEPLWWFAQTHPAFAWLAAGAAALVVLDSLAERRRSAVLLIVALVLLAAVLTWQPLLATLSDDRRALVTAVGALVPIAWLSWVDIRDAWPRMQWNAPSGVRADDARMFLAAVAASVYVGLVYVAAGWFRGGSLGPGLAERLAAHLAIFAATFSILMLVRGLAGLRRSPDPTEFVLIGMTLAGAAAAVIYTLVFESIAFTGREAAALSVVTGAVLASAAGGAILAAWSVRGWSAPSGAAAWMQPVWLASSRPRVLMSASLLAVGVLVASKSQARMDWNFLGQKLTALVVWMLALRLAFVVVPNPVRLRWPVLLALATAAPLAFARLYGHTDPGVLDGVAAYDPSFRLIRDAVTRSGPTADADLEFYEFLHANTNIPRDHAITPVDYGLVPSFTKGPERPPDVFLFVIDSLRRDYLSPFNSAVTFTPAIDRFAAESMVFSNAFTHYGATGLSEPSIWAGGLLIHQQYVLPFAPMNTLQKVVDAHGFRQYVSVDTILRQLLAPNDRRVALDDGVPNMNYDFCGSLGELQSKLRAQRDDAPVFAYTQPQDIHIATITRAGATAVDAGSYAGFYAPYASRVRRLDRCLGDFVEFLKLTGRYDRSIVVLTSDHGDSLGEHGRWGHAYTIFPEVMRVPLILHVPAALRARLGARPTGPAFLTDITPTLYELLGESPARGQPLAGRRLLWPSVQDPPALPREALMVSSYGSVYGLLRDEGRQLYIVDAINFRDYLYDLTAGTVGEEVAVPPAVRTESRRVIRERVEEIARVYHFQAR